jgi:hypothetical protein
MDTFLDSIRKGFAGYLTGFRNSLVADTPALAEYIQRPVAKAIVKVADRMVDDVNKMLDAWRRNNTSQQALATPFLPIMFYATAKDYTASPPDWSTRQMADPQLVQIPGDPKNRVLELRSIERDLRAQVVIVAAEDGSASSLATQFHLWVKAKENRRFQAIFSLAGQPTPWPVLIENPDIVAVNAPADLQGNITILAIDISLRPTVPIVKGPPPGEPNDGQGDGSYENPSGYTVVVETDATATGRSDLVVSDADSHTTVVTDAGVVRQTPLVFQPVEGANQGQAYISNAVVLANLDAPVAITVAGGLYSINGGAFTAAPGTASNGDSILVQVTAALAAATPAAALLFAGAVYGQFTVTTS